MKKEQPMDPNLLEYFYQSYEDLIRMKNAMSFAIAQSSMFFDEYEKNQSKEVRKELKERRRRAERIVK